MTEKPWYLSKTVWLNAATFVVAVSQLLMEQPWLSPSAVSVLGTIVAIANLYLRTTTDSKLTK